MKEKKYPCPCCGYYTFTERLGSMEICPICYWEDDYVQAKDPDFAGGANRYSLNQARENYKLYGACEERFIESVRKPLQKEIKYGLFESK